MEGALALVNNLLEFAALSDEQHKLLTDLSTSSPSWFSSEEEEEWRAALHGRHLCRTLRYAAAWLHMLARTRFNENNQSNQEAASAMVRKLLMDGVKPSSQDKAGMTGLHHVADWLDMVGDGLNNATVQEEEAALALVSQLLEHGVDPNIQDKHGRTALHYIVDRFNSRNEGVALAIVKKMCEYQMDANVQDISGQTALHSIVSSMDEVDEEAAIALVTNLLKHGIDPNAPDRRGWRPLHYMVRYNAAPALIATVLQGGADPKAPDQHGVTPLHIAVRKLDEHNLEDTVACAAKIFEHEVRLGFTLPSSFLVVKTNGSEVPKPLFTLITIEQGTDRTRGLNNEDVTALHFKVQRLDEVSYEATLSRAVTLLDQGVDPRVRNHCGETFLHVVVENLNQINEEVTMTIVTKLLKSGVDPNAMDEHRLQTCLHILAKKSMIDGINIWKLLVLLLEYGADSTMKDICRNLPFSYLVGSTSVFEWIRYMVRLGIGSCYNPQGSSSPKRMIQREKDMNETMTLLMTCSDRFPDPPSLLKLRAKWRNRQIVGNLLDRFPLLSDWLDDKKVQRVSLPLIVKLWVHGLDFSSALFGSPLHGIVNALDSENGERILETVRVLLTLGANVKMRGGNGETVAYGLLERLATDNQNATFALIAELAHHGLDPHALYHMGESPLHLIVTTNYWDEEETSLEAVRLFLKLGANVNWHNLDGRTALHCLLRGLTPHSQKATIALVNTLLVHGADPEMQDHEGMSPVQYFFNRPLDWDDDPETILALGIKLIQHMANPFGKTELVLEHVFSGLVEGSCDVEAALAHVNDLLEYADLSDDQRRLLTRLSNCRLGSPMSGTRNDGRLCGWCKTLLYPILHFLCFPQN